eukprot:scaffold43901_cov298-Isochrysis_galbana.AAC.1
MAPTAAAPATTSPFLRALRGSVVAGGVAGIGHESMAGCSGVDAVSGWVLSMRTIEIAGCAGCKLGPVQK